jgi:predicted HTH domain antitoxin
METLKIPYPEELLTEFGETPEEFEREMRVLVAAKLYEMGRITSGRAAEMTGMERVSFLNKLEHYDVSIINYSAEELEREIKEAQRRARDG